MGKVQMTSVVIDTNVIVSALLFGGKPGELIRFFKTGQIQPIISKEITEEYLRVLAYPKFDLSEKEISFLFNHEILPYFKAVKIKPGHWKTTIEDDPSDDMFIRCAVFGKCNIIISGDGHLLDLKTYDKIRILSVSEFLKEFAT
ncbi:MAG TPA: putative toxin-antitoxin system toxin component, PIN family [Desulfobacterales bacterium]|nr:putative toxin-antitoxin system toxin component, PIN family [Desulfobacterales bacterium]